ncbi:MAG: agmatinase family protein [Myxococcales bacterium]|nr:agmatinase family protein [Myxococcales bacterium]
MDDRFDPNAAADETAGVYGLPFSVDAARVVVLPVPFAATTSYRRGAQKGPAAVLEASRQVDLYDHEWGNFWEAGIAMCPPSDEVMAWEREASALAETVIAVGGRIGDDPALRAALDRVNVLSGKVNDFVYAAVADALAAGKEVALVGGDHAVPLGAIRAHAARWPGVGLLHLDAHADLRRHYEGFTYSHASIIDNVLEEVPGVSRVVQVGIRDFCEEERARIDASAGRVVTFFDADLATRAAEGVAWQRTVDEIVAALPAKVYLTFDIDGLDPTLCPNTGTPVPGGLSWREVCGLLRGVVRSGREIVGLDLVEVAPGADSDWDANVGARILYKMIGAMRMSKKVFDAGGERG